MLKKQHTIDRDQRARSIVLYMENAVILDDYWFFCTCFSIFIHSKVDGCADASRVGMQERIVSFIRKKTRTGKDYFELTARFLNVELFVKSGFFGHLKSKTVASSSYKEKGLVLMHPLFLESKNHVQVATSSLLRIMVNKCLSPDEIKAALSEIMQAEKVTVSAEVIKKDT